ncbi:hypothetical protein ACQ4M3_13035 [Leptolyngbya sp. AN03gr2]|uniref:hypothetical protein n=1 Tax=unclassified Leptolyngbya TaxID=2650499 RepID=UPI003D32278A
MTTFKFLRGTAEPQPIVYLSLRSFCDTTGIEYERAHRLVAAQPGFNAIFHYTLDEDMILTRRDTMLLLEMLFELKLQKQWNDTIRSSLVATKSILGENYLWKEHWNDWEAEAPKDIIAHHKVDNLSVYIFADRIVKISDDNLSGGHIVVLQSSDVESFLTAVEKYVNQLLNNSQLSEEQRTLNTEHSGTFCIVGKGSAVIYALKGGLSRKGTSIQVLPQTIATLKRTIAGSQNKI